jgi:hypothetical protein
MVTPHINPDNRRGGLFKLVFISTLTWPIAKEDFNAFRHCESFKSYFSENPI